MAFEFPLRNGEVLRIDAREYKGKHYLDMRIFYGVEEDGDEGKPGKGVTIHHSRAHSFFKELRDWIKDEGLDLAKELGENGQAADDEDDEPRSKKSKGKSKRSRDEDDEDERPRRKKAKRSRDEDEDEDEPRSKKAKRSSSDEDDEDEEKPRSKKRKTSRR